MIISYLIDSYVASCWNLQSTIYILSDFGNRAFFCILLQPNSKHNTLWKIIKGNNWMSP